MTPKHQEAAETRIRHAMANLLGNPEFTQFINILRTQREIAIEDACTDAVVSNERASMAAIGEIRAYKNIITVYDEFVAKAAMAAEERGQEPVE